MKKKPEHKCLDCSNMTSARRKRCLDCAGIQECKRENSRIRNRKARKRQQNKDSAA